MHATTTTVELLYISDGPEEPDISRFGSDDGEISVSTATGDEDILTDLDQYDCLLFGPSVGGEPPLRLLGRVREREPTLPILVFTGGRGPEFVSACLEAGATDVIRSALSETPPDLLRARIAGVLDSAAASVVRTSDIDRRRELRERERLLDHISQTVGSVIWVTTPEKDEMEFVSQAYEEVWGRPREKLFEDAMAFVEAIHPADRERVREAIGRQQVDPDAYDETYRVVQPNGEVRWIRDRAFGVYEDGDLERIVGIAHDITERKERERDLQAERDIVERILDTSPVGICVLSRDGDVVRVNERAAEIFGLTRETFAERSYDDDRWTVYDENGDPVPPERFPASTIFDTGEPVYNWEAVAERPSGKEVTISISGAPIRGRENPDQVVLVIEDITERTRQREKIEAQRDELAELDRLNAVIRDVDQALVGADSREDIEQTVCERLTASGRYSFAVALRERGDGTIVPSAWTEAAAEMVERTFPVEGASPETTPALRAFESGEVQVDQAIRAGEKSAVWEQSVLDAGIEALADIPLVYEGRNYGTIAVYTDEQGDFGERELEVLGELGETVGHAIAAVERRERERTLTSLYEATRALLGVETHEEVCEVVVDVARDVLELEAVGVWLFDDEDNVLRPERATDVLESFYGGTTVFGPGRESSETWQAYVTGDPRVFDDIRDSERLVDPDTDARSVLCLPLGEHGVFVAAATEVGVFGDQERDLVGLLAATTESALDRVEDRAGLRERDRELAERTQRLERLNRINELIREIDQHLVRAATRAEIEQGVCERLVAAGPFAFAWVGRAQPDEDDITATTWAGESESYLDDISLSVADGGDPGVRTAATGETNVITNVADHLREGEWARAAADRGYQSVVAVPLVYGETTYGVLTVYADEPAVFDEMVSSVLAELGETIAYSINVAETKQGILAERVTELDVRIAGPNTFLNTVARLAGESVEYLEISPQAESGANVIFELTDPPVAEILALESEFVGVESLNHARSGERDLFRASVSGRTIASAVLECGGIPATVVADADETTVTVRLSQELDARIFLDRLEGLFPDVELTARRDREQSGAVEQSVRTAMEEELTDRQREVLQTAYESGFFESPRGTTGSELADLLDISQPTLTHHLREGQRRLFAALFGDESR